MKHLQKLQHQDLEIYLLPDSSPLDEEKYSSELFSEEIALLQEMKSPKRRREFLRRCWLFHQMGSNAPLAKTEQGGPKWPEGYLGSLTHKAGHVLMYIEKAHKVSFAGIGIDLEDMEKMHEGLFSKICQPEELAKISACTGERSLSEIMTVVFSFKESIFKAIHPLGHIFFYFHDATIETIDLARGVITARLEKNVSPLTPEGYLCHGFFQDIELDGKRYVLSSCRV